VNETVVVITGADAIVPAVAQRIPDGAVVIAADGALDHALAAGVRPAGLVGDEGDQGPEATARKELEEETGYVCERVEFLAKGPTSPGITSELVSFYRAQSVAKKGEHEEEITVHEIARDEIDAWLRSRGDVMVDLKVWGGLHFRFSTDAGGRIGTRVADWTLTHAFRRQRGCRRHTRSAE